MIFMNFAAPIKDHMRLKLVGLIIDHGLDFVLLCFHTLAKVSGLHADVIQSFNQILLSPLDFHRLGLVGALGEGNFRWLVVDSLAQLVSTC